MRWQNLLTSILAAVLAIPTAAQAESSNLLDSLFGGGEIRENIVYRQPLGPDGAYEATVYGSRVQGVGYLEIALVNATTGEPIPPDTDIVLRVRQPTPRTYTGVYQEGYFLFDHIDFPQSRRYDLQLRLNGGAPLNMRLYVYPSAPDTPPAFVLGNILVPVIFLVVMLGGYALFRVQFLPDPQQKSHPEQPHTGA